MGFKFIYKQPYQNGPKHVELCSEQKMSGNPQYRGNRQRCSQLKKNGWSHGNTTKRKSWLVQLMIYFGDFLGAI